MTSKKPKPNAASAKSATTPPPASGPAESTPGELVRLHDLSGVAVFYLPAQLREILGAQLLSQQLDDLRRTQITLIVRTPGEVIYVDLPLLIQTLPAERAAVIDAAKAPESDTARRSGRGNKHA